MMLNFDLFVINDIYHYYELHILLQEDSVGNVFLSLENLSRD